MDPDAIDRVVRKYAAELGLDRGYSAHSMRATFITTALENGSQLEDVQKAAGHRDPGTTKLNDRRGYNPEKAASFFLQPINVQAKASPPQNIASWGWPAIDSKRQRYRRPVCCFGHPDGEHRQRGRGRCGQREKGQAVSEVIDDHEAPIPWTVAMAPWAKL
jgi:integrase-like protein